MFLLSSFDISSHPSNVFLLASILSYMLNEPCPNSCMGLLDGEPDPNSNPDRLHHVLQDKSMNEDTSMYSATSSPRSLAVMALAAASLSSLSR
jgi:hypothetical protein